MKFIRPYTEVSIFRQSPPVLLFSILFLSLQIFTQAMAADPVAWIVSFSGDVQIRRAAGASWEPAVVNASLYARDQIHTGANGKAAILLSDETQMAINHNSQLELKEVSQSSGWQRLKGLVKTSMGTQRSDYELGSGEIWLRNKNRDININVNSTIVSAGIRGTEFNMRINPDNSVDITVLEGTVAASNTLGSLNAVSGEQVKTVPGSAPRKVALVQPQDAVQWTLAIPPLFGPRSFPLVSADRKVLETELASLPAASPGVPDQIRRGQVLRDLGRSQEAIAVFEKALKAAPDTPEAATGLGWALLDTGRYDDALAAFNGSRAPDLLNYIGKTLAFAQQNRLSEAHKVVEAGSAAYPSAPLVSIASSYILLLEGNLRGAQAGMEALVATNPEQTVAWDLLALASVVLGDNDKAVKAANTAVSLAPDSPEALLVHSYTRQAVFDLDGASASVRRALDADPDNVMAWTDLARLQFGSDDLDGASDSIGRAVKLAPDDEGMLQLRGFILLARHDLAGGEQLFQRVLGLNPGNGEAYLGLSLIHMRQGDVAAAMEEIAKASLLEPQRAIFLSYWGKMLYQIQRFDKALDVLHRAQQLDPRDPTNEFYRAIILRDMNRHGEAIRALNRAVALNDYRGVYRSRFLLDRDLAVKNVDLSFLYRKLGLNTWAERKAVSSIKQDYLNSSGHLFFAGSLYEQGGRDYAFVSETLLARLLQPANINTFNTFNDYTSLFEEPGVNAFVDATIGTQKTRNGDIILDGAVPRANLAWQAGLVYESTDGWRGTNFEKLKSFAGIGKWQPTTKDGIMVAASYTDTRQGDANYPRYEYDSPADPVERNNGKITRVELGYHHHFSPGTDLLIYLARLDIDLYVKNHDTAESPFVIPTSTPVIVPFPGFIRDTVDDIDFANPYYQGQLTFMYKYGRHQFLDGVVVYRGIRKAHDLTTTNILFDNQPVIIPPYIPFLQSTRNNLDISFQSFYLTDIWNVMPSLTLELAAYYDVMDNANALLGTHWTVKRFNPRAGVIFTPTVNDTIRLAAFRYLIPFISSRTDPTEIAGIPIIRNTEEGAVNTEYDIVWEHEWGSGMFSANLFSLDKRYKDRVIQGGVEVGRKFKGNFDGLEIKLDQLVTDIIGLNASYHHYKIDDELVPETNRNEDEISAGLKFILENGLSGGIKQIYRHLDLKGGRDDESIPVTDLELGYEFPRKIGTVNLEIRNLFDKHFNWVTDRFVFQGRAPEREILGTISLNY